MLPFKKYKTIFVSEDANLPLNKVYVQTLEEGYFERSSVATASRLQPSYNEHKPQINFNEDTDAVFKAAETYTQDQLKLFRDCTEPFNWEDSLPKPHDSVVGVECHQCGQRDAGPRTRCTKCYSGKGHLCGTCLQIRYGENITGVLCWLEHGGSWICPACRGICNCAECRRRKGYPPASIVLKGYDSTQYKSVAHYLVNKFLVDDARTYVDPEAQDLAKMYQEESGELYPGGYAASDSSTETSSEEDSETESDNDIGAGVTRERGRAPLRENQIKTAEVTKRGHPYHISSSSGSSTREQQSDYFVTKTKTNVKRKGKKTKNPILSNSEDDSLSGTGDTDDTVYVPEEKTYMLRGMKTLDSFVTSTKIQTNSAISVQTRLTQSPGSTAHSIQERIINQQDQHVLLQGVVAKRYKGAELPSWSGITPNTLRTSKVKSKEKSKGKTKGKGKVKGKGNVSSAGKTRKTNVYEVERIIDMKEEDDGIQYLVKWVGYDEPSWEPQKNCDNCQGSIEEFLNSKHIK